MACDAEAQAVVIVALYPENPNLPAISAEGLFELFFIIDFQNLIFPAEFHIIKPSISSIHFEYLQSGYPTANNAVTVAESNFKA
jgi:hypothetical protein